MDININLRTEELAEGQTIGQFLAEKFGGATELKFTVGAVTSDLPDTTKLEEKIDRLAETDTSLEDDANEAAADVEAAAVSYGDPTKEPTLPPTTATPAAEAISVPATQTAAEAVVPDSTDPVAPATPLSTPTHVHGVEVDSAGVPWSAEIHSSNKKQYGKGSGGAKAGRWNWKRNTDETVREEKAQQLAADLRTAAASVPAPVVAPVPTLATPVAAPVVAPVVVPLVVPVAENAAPAAVAPEVAPNIVSALGWNWANFLEAMTLHQATAESILAVAAQYGVTTIPELSPRTDVLEAVAVALQWPAPVAV